MGRPNGTLVFETKPEHVPERVLAIAMAVAAKASELAYRIPGGSRDETIRVVVEIGGVQCAMRMDP